MRNKPSQELLAELGIAAEQTRVIANVELDVGTVGHGLSGATGSPFELSDHFVRTALGSQNLPFVLTKHQLESAVFRVEELSGRIQKTAGSAQRRDDDVLLDARAGRSSGVLLETAEGQMLIHAGPGGVTVSIVGQEGDFRAWESWRSLPDALSVSVPSLAELTGGLACDPWLEARHAALASAPQMVAQVAAAGVVVRLWIPGPAERESAPDPSSLIGRWARKLTSRDLDAMERLAVERAGVVRQELDGLPNDSEVPAHDVIKIAYDRDALECVLTVLWLAGRGRQLGPELSATDDAAVTSLSALPISDEIEADPLLRAVYVSEPDAWWGQLVSG